MRLHIGIALAPLGAPVAAAQEPTIDQLLATPTATEIVERWKAVCLDHAGDEKAQRDAVKATGLTWPYQAYFHPRGKKVDCLIASSTKAGTTIDDFSGPLSAAIPAAEFKPEGKALSADIQLEGKAYWVGVSSSDMGGGNLVSTLVLAVK